MTRDSRYDILFEPVNIGPVTAKSRFCQAPHCNGMERISPSITLLNRKSQQARRLTSILCRRIFSRNTLAPDVTLSFFHTRDERQLTVRL